MDTRDKRCSAIYVLQPWRGMLPLPDSSLDQGDRQHVAFVYRGILAGAPGGATLIALERAAFRRVFGRVWGRIN